VHRLRLDGDSMLKSKKWCGWRGSNPRPLASEANTLSTELQPQQAAILSGAISVRPIKALAGYNLMLIAR
jgi:hypothetical protein